MRGAGGMADPEVVVRGVGALGLILGALWALGSLWWGRWAAAGGGRVCCGLGGGRAGGVPPPGGRGPGGRGGASEAAGRLADFERPGRPWRAALHVLAAAWLLVQLMRMPSAWGWGVLSPTGLAEEVGLSEEVQEVLRPAAGEEAGRISEPWQQRLLCELYIALGAGVLEPAFLAAALLFLRRALPPRRPGEGRWAGGSREGACWRLGLVELGAALLALQALGQVAAAWLEVYVPASTWEEAGVASYVYAASVPSRGADCGAGGPERECVLCIFSLVSVAISGVALSVFLVYLQLVARRLRLVTMNVQILRRLRVLELSLYALVPASVIVRSLILIPQLTASWIEALWLVYYGILVCICALVLLVLSVLPMSETSQAMKHFKLREESRAFEVEPPHTPRSPAVARAASLPPPAPSAGSGARVGLGSSGRGAARALNLGASAPPGSVGGGGSFAAGAGAAGRA